LTAEQKRILDEQLAEENRRIEREKLDNWRDRGLMEMMAGVLQIRREDELKKDIPVPSFVKEKQQDEWTQDDIKQFQVYEQKVKELNEEREKLRKVSLQKGQDNKTGKACVKSFLHLRYTVFC
jgi:hypothetical protein